MFYKRSHQIDLRLPQGELRIKYLEAIHIHGTWIYKENNI